MNNKNLVGGLFTLAAQAMATNLACCSDFQKFTGLEHDFGADGLAFSSLFGAAAVFEFVAVMVYFFLVTKGCGSTLPGWFFDAMMITSVFWFNKDAIFSPARIWSGGYNWSTMFGTY